MTPARTWILVVAVAAAATLGVLALASALERGNSRIPRIDVHQHLRPGTLDDAMRLGAAWGVAGLVNLDGDDADGTLQAQIAAAARFAGRVQVFMSVDFHGCCGETWLGREASRLVQGKTAGARGVNVHEDLGLAVRDEDGRVPVDSPKLEPLWDLVAGLRLPVTIHTGDARAFFEPPGPGNERAEELKLAPQRSFADRSRYPDWATLHREFVRLVERHPRVTFIGAHFGNDAEDPEAVSRLLDRLPNLYVDTAARVPELGRHAPAARAAILRHPDRVLYGTDLVWLERGGQRAVVLGAGPPFALTPAAAASPEVVRFFQGTFRFFETQERDIRSPTPIQGRWAVEGLGLPREVLEQVYRRNAERLLGFRLEEGAR
ncbi:MAG TPA: amidohydrolase family protein [Anaeromyxobacteraceae bacterium]|nr:amidohydrolase family protein [Anaeromyxobacteraceae bacterium]